MVIGTLITMPFVGGPVRIGPLTFSFYWQFVGGALAVVGLNMYLMGCLAQVFFDYTGKRTARLLYAFRYTRTLLAAMATMVFGVVLMVPLSVKYLRGGLRLNGPLAQTNYLFLSGVFFVMAGFSLFAFTLLIHAAATASKSMTWRRQTTGAGVA